ncbi:MAG: ATP synthase F1 subunit epsilon [Planctomycetaceae bacterium]|nr:ATP synthase F1 subunit epsilon [Planctomycetaceae bacterium]
MPTEPSLRLVIVTPEKTLLDETVSALSFPLYDGGIGILPGRLPLIGRLGTGELKITQSGGERHFFIDGGFVQVRGGVVTLLTNNAVNAGDLSPAAAQQELDAALKVVPTTDEGFKAKSAAQQRARRKLSLAKRPR